MRALALLAVLFVACSTPTTPVPTPQPTREPGTLTVAVLLDLSGPRAPSGQAQKNAVQLWIDQPPTSTLKIHVSFVDVAGSDAKLLLAVRRAVVEDRADALVIGVPVALEGALSDAIKVAAVPVLLTLPNAEPAGAPGGAFTFALAPSPDQIARAVVGDLVDRSLLQPMLLAGDASHAAAVERGAIVAELKHRALAIPGAVSLDTPDGAQRARAAAAFAKSVVLAGASAPYGDVIRSIPVAAGAPVVYLSYLTETADVTNLREGSALVTWPGSRTLAFTQFPATTSPSFQQRFTEKYGAPSTIAASAYDALLLIDAAATATAKELDPERLRERLEANTFSGIVTDYTFSPSRHLGFALKDLALLRWNAQVGRAFVPSQPGEPER